jgi:hypothetical protein
MWLCLHMGWTTVQVILNSPRSKNGGCMMWNCDQYHSGCGGQLRPLLVPVRHQLIGMTGTQHAGFVPGA